MVSSYKRAENNERPKNLLLTVNTNQGIMTISITGVFRTETALIDQALRKGTLYRTTGELGDMIAIAPKQIVSIGEVLENENQD
ncbi:hypothetical protein ACLUYC_04215 [Limosilactobacillus mucosae]